MDNYEIAKNRAQAHFLGFDQSALIRAWGLHHDERFLYARFLGLDYKICRKTGMIFRMPGTIQADFSEVLSIFDFLCHAGTEKTASGVFAPVNSLTGSPKTGGVSVDFHKETALAFDQDPEAFKLACASLGGIWVDMGDIGFQFPLFSDLSVILKFYHADEDFPASITLLWDQNLLKYIHYETVFYIAGFLLKRITDHMPKGRCKWCNLKNPRYVKYHDEEWGVPNFDDRYLFEMLLLESFQAGLSWECVLNKRDAFRNAFDGFAVEKVAAYGEEKVAALIKDPGIIRNRLKIRTAVNNAKIFISIQKQYGSFHAYLETFTKKNTIIETGKTTSSLSDAISADLIKRGMRFVGSTIVYAYLQAIGVVNSHEEGCFLHK